jgi:hypothetical protein
MSGVGCARYERKALGNANAPHASARGVIFSGAAEAAHAIKLGYLRGPLAAASLRSSHSARDNSRRSLADP